MAEFDRSVYVALPRTTLRRKLALARLLLRHAPAQVGADVERHTRALSNAVGVLERALTSQRVEVSSATPKQDAELDNLAVVLWEAACERLEHWRAFTLPAARRFTEVQLRTPDPAPGQGQDPMCDYAGHLAKAATFARARALLLSTGGVEFAGLDHGGQADKIRKLWHFVDEEGLAPILAEGIGPEFLASLRDVQMRYLAMLETRLSRVRVSTISIRSEAAALDQALQTYLFALLVALDESRPESLAETRAALRPMDALRTQLALERYVVETSAAANDESLAEFIAEEQAIERTLDGFSIEAVRPWADHQPRSLAS